MTLLQSTRFNPWKELDRFFDIPAAPAVWRPAFDVSETDGAFVLRGDIPGVAQDDIEVRVEDNVLSLRGERKPDEAGAERSCTCCECPSGKFARSFVLPDTADLDGIKATYDQGVIELVVPKHAPADTSRLVPVN